MASVWRQLDVLGLNCYFYEIGLFCGACADRNLRHGVARRKFRFTLLYIPTVRVAASASVSDEGMWMVSGKLPVA